MKMNKKFHLSDYSLFTGIGSILLLIGLGLLCWNYQLKSKGKQVIGIVTELEQDAEGAFSPVISYYQNGKQYTHHSITYLNPSAFRVGEKVSLYIDPNNPGYATLGGIYDLIAAFTSTIIGSILLLGTLIAYRINQRKAKFQKQII